VSCRLSSTAVIPAQAGIHFDFRAEAKMDSGLRRNDKDGGFARGHSMPE
jgi:hypothetical protein